MSTCENGTLSCVFLGRHSKCIAGKLPATTHEAVPDMVEHPPHYKQGGIETIDVIEAWQLGFCLGNAIKYISRAGKKDPAAELEDLKKARFYLNREIANIEKARAGGTDD